MLDIFKKVREEVRLNIQRDGNLVKPLSYNESQDGQLCYNSGGRGVVFPYDGRAIRVKGIIDPNGMLTKKIASSERNKIYDVKRYTENLEYGSVAWKPFAVLSLEDAENEKNSIERLNSLYEKAEVSCPYSVEDIVETGQLFRGEETYQLYFGLANMEDDLRVAEINELILEKLGRLPSKNIKEREADILRLYEKLMEWHGFSVKCLMEAKLLPSDRTFVPQNYVVSRTREGYGAFLVDHTSTRIRDEMSPEQLFMELNHRISKSQPYGILSPFLRMPEAVIIAANRSEQVPDDGRPLLERCCAYSRSIQPVIGEEIPDIFAEPFYKGFRTKRPKPIEEKYFRRVLTN